MADKTGYIGRNPGDSAVTVARQFFTASGVTTAFTFASGYLTGYLDIYVDGVKKRVADEFTATDGSTFDVLQGGVGAGSTVEAVAYKAFNATTVSGDITGNFDVSGNTTLGGSLDIVGGTTLTNLVVTGISTLGTGTTVGFANTAFNLGGTPNISVDLLSAVDINVSGAATIGGVLTYEDVTNIDSIGIVTARTGVEVTANGLVVNAGVGTFAADVSIADKIVHTGDTNTAIRFPSPDTFTIETTGIERVRVDSTGDVGLVGIATATGLVVVAGSGIYAGHTGVITATSFDGSFVGNITGAASQVTVADESSDTTCFPLFTTAATGDLPPKSGTNLTFNSSSGALTATSFVGALTGAVTVNSDTATTATTSTNVTVADESSDTTCFPLFATAATGNLPPKSGTNLTFNSSSGALTATSFSGNISGGTIAGTTGTFTGFVDCVRSASDGFGYLGIGPGGTDEKAAFVNRSGEIDFELYSNYSSSATVSINSDGSATFSSTLTSKPSSAAYAYQVNNGSTNYGGLYRDTSSSRLILGDGSTTKVDLKGSNGTATFAGTVTAGTETGTGTNVYASGSIQGIVSGTQKWYISPAGVATFTGTVSDSIGPLRRLGTTTVSSNYTLVASDAGKQIVVSGAPAITCPDNVFTAGDMITIVANSSSNPTIVEGSGVTLYNASDGSDGNVTLAARTVCTILVAAGQDTMYVAGGGIS